MAEKPKQILELEEYWGIEIEVEDYKIENGQVIALAIHGKKISDLRPLKKHSGLTKLMLSGNHISDLSPITGLINLRDLYLSENMIVDITPLKGMTNLKLLSLGNNGIYELPLLHKLINLEELYLWGNHITDITPLSRLNNLINLDLDLNLISDPSPLKSFENLTTLSIVGNQITHLNALEGLQNLTFLSLSNNFVSDLTPLKSLKNLINLDVSDNELEFIENLYPLLALDKLESIDLDENPVVGILPAEELSVGWQALKEYLQGELDKSLVDINEVKVLLLGNGNVGKSTLLDYLEHGKINKKIERTDGIQYKRLTKFVQGVNIHVWDFGGQEYFHATHKLFFSEGALHILMWNNDHKKREGEEQERAFELHYWLRCSEQLIENEQYKDINVLVTENKIGTKAPRLIDQARLKKQYPSLNLYFTAINLYDPPKRLEGFKEILKEQIAALPILSSRKPKHYKSYLDQINNAKLSSKKFLLIKDFSPNSDADEDQIRLTMRVFHLMGFVLYFPLVIPDKIFVEPKVLLDLLYDAILDKKAKDNDGRIAENALKNAIKSNALNLNIKEVKALLQHFDLIFQIPGETHWFAPQYLPKDEQVWIEFFTRHHFSFPNVTIASDSYLMNVALLELFTKYGCTVKRREGAAGEYLFWRDGLVIEKDNQVLLVKLQRETQSMQLFGDKEGKNLELQKEVITFVAGLGKRKKDSQLKTKHQVEDREKRKNEDISWAQIWENSKFDILLSANGKDYIRWKKLYRANSSVITEDDKQFLVRDFLGFLPKDKMRMKKIFISYSKDDLARVNKFIDHLAALQINGEVDTWYCTELKPGEKWEDTIQSHFDEADIICFMISPNFMKTKYIHQYEIPRAFKRLEESEPPAIVPIVIDFCDWSTKEHNLQKFTALPYTLKPVADFDNEHMAWYIVEAMLKQIIAAGNNLKTHEELLAKIPTDVRKIYERIVEGKVDKGGK